MGTPLYPSIFQLYIALYDGGFIPTGHDVWVALGNQKTGAEFNLSEKLTEVKNIEEGTEGAVISEQPLTAKLFLVDLDLTKLQGFRLAVTFDELTEEFQNVGTFDELAEICNLEGYNVDENTIGTITNVIGVRISECIIRLHPVEHGAVYDQDIIITHAIINKKFNKKGVVGEQAVLEFEVLGMNDDNDPEQKLVIGWGG
jgi:hypothetical protein